ncbi:MAG: hypothetical protein RR278_06310 [Mucinivorans sp.]
MSKIKTPKEGRPEVTCAKCGYKSTIHTKNGYTIAKRVHKTQDNRIARYICYRCGCSFYDHNALNKKRMGYTNTIYRIATHLFIEGYSCSEISDLLAKKYFPDVRIRIEDWVESQQFRQLEKATRDYRRLGEVVDPENAKTYNKRTPYTFSLLVQERQEVAVVELVNGNIRRYNQKSAVRAKPCDQMHGKKFNNIVEPGEEGLINDDYTKGKKRKGKMYGELAITSFIEKVVPNLSDENISKIYNDMIARYEKEQLQDPNTRSYASLEHLEE